MTRPRLLDLFCGAGGAAMGYHRAGFEVVGVDIEPQPRYPFQLEQEDAMRILASLSDPYFAADWDAIHASPPCQAYSTATADPSKHPDLYEPTKRLLQATGLPWVIENVIGAPYRWGIRLCGTMFGLQTPNEWLRRHRNFETSDAMLQPQCLHRRDVQPVTITSSAYVSETRSYRHSPTRAMWGRQPTFELAQQLMGIDWMNRRELGQAIPPAYTEYVGAQLLDHLKAGAA